MAVVMNFYNLQMELIPREDTYHGAPTTPTSRSESLRTHDVILCSSDNWGGMKRRDKEIRKQPGGDPSSGENPGILLLVVSFHPGYLTTTVAYGCYR